MGSRGGEGWVRGWVLGGGLKGGFEGVIVGGLEGVSKGVSEGIRGSVRGCMYTKHIESANRVINPPLSSLRVRASSTIQSLESFMHQFHQDVQMLTSVHSRLPFPQQSRQWILSFRGGVEQSIQCGYRNVVVVIVGGF